MRKPTVFHNCLRSYQRGFGSFRILQDVADALHASNHHVLRFNSRGVGQSTGRSSFSGQAETDDLRELVQKTIDDNLPNITRLAIVGESVQGHSGLGC